MLSERIDSWKDHWYNDGRVEGRVEGERQILLKLLTRRFGELPTWVQDKVNLADTDLLEEWTCRVLDETSLEAVFKA